MVMQETSGQSGTNSLIGDVLGNNAGGGGYHVETEKIMESRASVSRLVVSMKMMCLHA